MLSMWSRPILPVAVGLVVACNQAMVPPDLTEAGPALTGASLVASASADGVTLENRSGGIVLFSVVDSLFFENGLASWCIGQDACGARLAAGERRLIPPEDIVGPPPRQKAVQVLWWELLPGTPEEKTARFQRIHLRLP
jgi:hypothetical protein